MSDVVDRQALKATRPASKWRNRYFAFRDFAHSDTGTFRSGGKEYSAERDWPSRDTAETRGQENEKNYPSFIKYLGAFPVEGA